MPGRHRIACQTAGGWDVRGYLREPCLVSDVACQGRLLVAPLSRTSLCTSLRSDAKASISPRRVARAVNQEDSTGCLCGSEPGTADSSEPLQSTGCYCSDNKLPGPLEACLQTTGFQRDCIALPPPRPIQTQAIGVVCARDVPSGKLPAGGRVWSNWGLLREMFLKKRSRKMNNVQMQKKNETYLFVTPSSFQVERIVLPYLKRCPFRAAVHFLNPLVVQRTGTKHSVLSPTFGNGDIGVEAGAAWKRCRERWPPNRGLEELVMVQTNSDHNKIVTAVLCVASAGGDAGRPVFN
ncbi:unnamed protein product [Arctogadus glacialis]